MKTGIRQIVPSTIRRLAFVGVAKNCGKTTTLNHVLTAAVADGRTVGLVSIGIDGERRDFFLGTRKPPIFAHEGQWLVSASEALQQSQARVEYVESLGFATPLGEVFAARVIEPGRVLLAGLRHRADLEQAIAVLEKHGADLVLVDGAYGRVMAARAGVVDAVIVATGAVVSADLAQVVDATNALVERLTLPVCDPGWQRDLLERAVDTNQVWLGGAQTAPKPLPAGSAIVGLRDAGQWLTDDVDAIAIPGLVSDRVVESLLAAGERPRRLLVPDGTSVHVSAPLWARFCETWSVRALSSTPVIAISINPTSPQGHVLDETRLRGELSARWPDIPIFNPVRDDA